MAFNLKNKKAQGVGIGIPGAWGTFKQITIDDIENAKTPEELEGFKAMLAREQINNPDLLAALESKKKNLNMTQMTQNVTNVGPVEDSNAPISVLPRAASVKAFNLKKAQEAISPTGDLGADEVDMQGDQLQELSQINQLPQQTSIKFKSGKDVRAFLDTEPDMQNSLQRLRSSGDQSDNMDLVSELVEDYYHSKEDPALTGNKERELERKGGEIFDALPPIFKEQDPMGTPKTFGEVQEIIKKLAIEHASKEKTQTFNLKKQAQHKALDNVIMWGPQPTPRVDPFLRQPVSDWHIMERNKGFGLVVDDIWNIDYESIWRQNIMDKYSRPYRDKDGNWVGGYIQKRFEVDKNIPETTNLQLKPGQRRKPVLPEYGNTESRLQTARSKGEIEGSSDASKPFNWKEANGKKKS